jgi:hypothetical protein
MVQVYVDGMSWHRVSIAYVFLALSRFRAVEVTPSVASMRTLIEVRDVVVDVSQSVDN